MWAIAANDRIRWGGGLYTGPPMPFGPRIRQGLAAAAAALVLAPAGAHAQGAGDDQYSDPFGSDNKAKATPTPRPAAPQATAAPTQAPPAATATASGPAPRATATPSAPTLPYTGVDGWPVAITGVLLLGGGIALRARLREPD